MTKTRNGHEGSDGKAYCTKCNNVVPNRQVKHEMGYAIVHGVGHTLVCVCVACFNKRYIETQPASRELTNAFTNWIIYTFAATKKNARTMIPKASVEFEKVAALHGIETYRGDGDNV